MVGVPAVRYQKPAEYHHLIQVLSTLYLSYDSLEVGVENSAICFVKGGFCDHFIDHKSHFLLANFIKSGPIEGLCVGGGVGLQNLSPLGLDTGIVTESQS